MMGKRSWAKTAALALLALAFLFSCSQMLDFNLFSKLDPVAVPQVTDYQGSEGLDKLDQDLDSPAIVDVLIQNPETVAEIEEMLEQEYLNDGVTTEEDQQAAIVYADLNLETSYGDDLVNNVVGTVLDLENADSATLSVKDLLLQIIPPEAAESPDVFTSMLLGLLDANNAYILFGNSIMDVNGDGVISAGEGVPPGANMGDIAQKALVAYMVDSIVDGLGLPPAEAGAQLYLLLYEPDSPDLAITDPAAPDPFALSPAHLLNIFAAAGLPFEASTSVGSGT